MPNEQKKLPLIDHVNSKTNGQISRHGWDDYHFAEGQRDADQAVVDKLQRQIVELKEHDERRHIPKGKYCYSPSGAVCKWKALEETTGKELCMVLYGRVLKQEYNDPKAFLPHVFKDDDCPTPAPKEEN